jgi:predicted Ser/Thr protein kinase
MEGIIAILATFGTPVAIVFILKYFKALEKGLLGPRARAPALSPAERQALDGLMRERQVLEARIQNLETIVCSVDLELNARLNRLAAEQSRLGLPAWSGALAGSSRAAGMGAPTPAGMPAQTPVGMMKLAPVEMPGSAPAPMRAGMPGLVATEATPGTPPSMAAVPGYPTVSPGVPTKPLGRPVAAAQGVAGEAPLAPTPDAGVALVSAPAPAVPALLPSPAPGGTMAALAAAATAYPVGFPGGEIRVGQVLLGRYTVAKELGRGGMGAVYLARDAELGEAVALKVISNALCCEPGAAERFRREASAARKITHPNVIRIHDLGIDGAVVFISMEYFAGMTLGQMLHRRGALPLDEAHDVLLQAADGLSAAHRVGVIHRDLKPQNVLVDASRRVKLIDFGLAKASFLDGMTATGLIMGTPEYMAPEQVRGRPVDIRTDVYAFGCVAFHTLAGVPPFRGDSPIAVGFMHCTQAPPALRQLRPDIPPAWETAINRALNKDPPARFEFIDEMRRAFA